MNYFKQILITILVASLSSSTLIAQPEDPHITGNVPITFYGKVVDQSNRPVPDVKISLEVRVGYLTSPTTGKERWDPVFLATDTNGNFILDGVKGGFVQFTSIEKEGYKLLPAQVKAGFMYYPDRFQPDINNPIIFKMWKRQGEEPLATSAWHGQVACDGSTNRFDLFQGSRKADGNLEIVCSRTPLQLPPHTNSVFDYSLQVTVIGGAIQPTEDDFSYLAPQDGYSNNFKVERKATDPKWTVKTKQEFYIKTSDGHYGRLWVDWNSTQTSPSHFEWNCTINPSGSRNLER